MKIAVISIISGVVVFAICLGLAVLAADDWNHEMADTDLSTFFLYLTIWPVIIVPESLIPNHNWVGFAWMLAPILNSLVIFSILFSVTQLRNRIANRT